MDVHRTLHKGVSWTVQRGPATHAGSFGELPGARIDLHGRRHPGGQYDALGHLIDMNTDRDALC
jgi:hypothetical protein